MDINIANCCQWTDACLYEDDRTGLMEALDTFQEMVNRSNEKNFNNNNENTTMSRLEKARIDKFMADDKNINKILKVTDEAQDVVNRTYAIVEKLSTIIATIDEQAAMLDYAVEDGDVSEITDKLQTLETVVSLFTGKGKASAIFDVEKVLKLSNKKAKAVTEEEVAKSLGL